MSIDWGPLLDPPATQPRRAANCWGCGRFCKSRSRSYFDGTWDQFTLTTMCAQCGEISEDAV